MSLLTDDQWTGEAWVLGTGGHSPVGSGHLKKGLGSPVSSCRDGVCCPVLGFLVVVFVYQLLGK